MVINESTTASGTLNASDPDGNALTYGIVSNGTLGIAKIIDVLKGTYTYTPKAGASGRMPRLRIHLRVSSPAIPT